MSKNMKAIPFAALMLAGAVGSAFAANLPKEGRYDFTSCWSGVSSTIAFSKTHSAFSYEMTGVVRSTTPGGLFDKSTFRCVGMNHSFDGKVGATTVCEGVDPDGDKRLSFFSTQGDKVTRENITGTGKYEGMVSSGTVAPLGPFPEIKPGTFQNCNQQTGTYKLK